MSCGRVLGVDACRAGWIGIASDPDGAHGYVGADISDLVGRAERDGELRVIAIDIPIGLPDKGRRSADVLAKRLVGSRRSSVFMTPVREALLAPDHATAVKINRDKAGEGISAQAYALRKRILSVDAWVRTTSRVVREVHPEVSFAHLAGRPLRTRKKTWDGAEQRRQLLATAGIDLAGLDVGHNGVAVDDVLDAAVAAWTARRVLTGEAMSIPDPPEQFSDGLPAAITV